MKKFLLWLKNLYIIQPKPVSIPEDKSVSQLALAIALNSQPADGVSANTVQATVTDANGAPVAGAVVNFSAPAGTVSPAQGTTDNNGQITASLISTNEGPASLVVALADGTTSTVSTLYFVAVPTPVVDPTSVNAPEPTAPDDAPATSVPVIAVTEHEKILAKVKELLIFLGHDVEAVFDEAVALAKKL